jgi:hypothetical protein
VATGVAYDEDFHALLTTFPEALLALVRLELRGPYRGEAIEVKAQSGRFDGVLVPTVDGDPVIYIEWQARYDAEAERRFALRVLIHCIQTGHFGPVVAVIIYTSAELARAPAPPRVEGPAGVVLDFAPMRVVLPELAAEELLSRGGPALLALPLVGDEAKVRAESRAWLREVRRTFDGPARRRALDIFFRFLAWRLSTLEATALLGEEELVDIDDTATGRAMIARGEAKGRAKGRVEGRVEGQRELLARQLIVRFGPLPADVRARIDQASGDELARWGERLLSVASLDDVFRDD